MKTWLQIIIVYADMADHCIQRHDGRSSLYTKTWMASHCTQKQDGRSSVSMKTWQVISVYDDIHDWRSSVYDNIHDWRSSMYDDIHDSRSSVYDNIHDWRSSMYDNIHDLRSSVYDDIHYWRSSVYEDIHDWRLACTCFYTQWWPSAMTARCQQHVSLPSLPASPVRNKGIRWRNQSKKMCKQRRHKRNVQRKAA